MTPIPPALRRDPWFWFGLVLKISLLAVATPLTQVEWFYPFISNVLAHYDINVWQSYLNYAPPDAPRYPFPYGPVMAVAFLPLTILGQGLDQSLHSTIYFGLGFKFTLLFFDFVA